MNDDVNNPAHYNQNGIEVIDVIETYAKHDFRLANVLKYVCRCEYKGHKLQDLQKAAWYLNRVIEELEDEESLPAIDEFEDYYLYIHPSPERVPGSDGPIHRDYYDYVPDTAVAVCANPACLATISNADAYIADGYGRKFCSHICNHLVAEAEARP